ncbi:glycoside hydrolase family 65 protein [Bacillus sp. BRMEA1]|uniref:glycoside hydrolase family 65 protein n=1 Tax=Neobacillus endophyticus TaxID=2738405 RepID=UPI00156374DA|nr:glycoside hydrolase family 65 protein [Neobacillus endophyticus]NRD76515.1 glycoside hydrolase family 65 protein [Neobacillus endophyticus]
MSWKISSSNLDSSQILVDESLFFTGNGYLGVRGNFEEGLPASQKTIRGTYINAFHDSVPIPYGEKHVAFPDTQQKLLNIIDAQTIEIYFGEERFSLAEGEILSFERKLHLDQGFTERIIDWCSPSGKKVKLCFKRLVSFQNQEAFIQRVELESSDDLGRVRIVSTINGDVSNFVDANDPRVASGHAKLLHVTNVEQTEGISFVECETTNTKLKTACAATYCLDVFNSRRDVTETTGITSEFTFDFTGKAAFEKKSIFVDTWRHGKDLRVSAIEQQRQLADKSFQHFLQEQIFFLQDFWKRSDVVITGDPAIQEGIRFNLYHLLQSAGRDRFSNISAKGLSGEGYEGHYFWDTEIYIFPVFLMTQPEMAKRLLLYRYSILDYARDHAKEMGHKKGALYPWRTISGTECSSYYPSGSAQYHISADIAYSFIQYYLVSGDLQFIKEYGAEVLFETARLWLDTGHYDGEAFKIDAVTGPDEYTCIVNNNYYTNVMAKHNLHWAVKFYQLLKEADQEAFAIVSDKIGLHSEEISSWQKAAVQMYLPYDEERKINPQDDTFLHKAVWDLANTPKEEFPLLLHYHPLTLYRYQVCKQADTVLAHFLLEDEQTIETIRNSYDYYEKITTHDSSLSTCIFSIMASKLGDHAKGYHYFNETARLDLDNTHGNTKDGLHMANMGGTWLAIVFGFAGLRMKEEAISFSPILPAKWEGYRFSIQYQGRRIQLEKTVDQTVIALLEGDALTIKLFDQSYLLEKAAPIKI